ncbi:MAG: hypothetical protein OCD76_15115 [Reichenbachiella sp.]
MKHLPQARKLTLMLFLFLTSLSASPYFSLSTIHNDIKKACESKGFLLTVKYKSMKYLGDSLKTFPCSDNRVNSNTPSWPATHTCGEKPISVKVYEIEYEVINNIVNRIDSAHLKLMINLQGSERFSHFLKEVKRKSVKVIALDSSVNLKATYALHAEIPDTNDLVRKVYDVAFSSSKSLLSDPQLCPRGNFLEFEEVLNSPAIKRTRPYRISPRIPTDFEQLVIDENIFLEIVLAISLSINTLFICIFVWLKKKNK